jgi:hypothetical protein
MSKFWRSGMIDKKVIKEREQAEYINKLERVILELRREEPDVSDLINGIDYDEVRVGDNVILDFGENIIATPRERVNDIIFNTYRRWLRKNADKRCEVDIEFNRKIKALENENNTRTLRQEE